MPIGPAWLRKRPVIVLLGVTALFYWKLIFSDRFTFLSSPDLAGQVLPWYDVQAAAWNDGVFPLWDPYVWSGQPLLGQMQPGGAFPLNWPLFAAPLADGHINFGYIHLHWALMHLLAAVFAYGLARELGRTQFTAVLAGLGFACSGFIASITWPQMINGAIWLPLTLLLFHRAARAPDTMRRIAYAVLCGGSVGMSLLSGHHQAPFFSLLALTGVMLGLVWFERQEQSAQWRAPLIAYACVGAVAFLVAGLQLLPAAEYGGDAYRWVNAPGPVGPGEHVPYFVHEQMRLYPITLLGLVTPRLAFQVSTFVGWVAMLFALYAVIVCWRERWVRLYALLGIAVLSFATATYSPLHGLIYNFVPIAHTARTPAFSIFVLQLAIFLLAARGIDQLLEQGAERSASCDWIRRGQLLLLTYCGVVYVSLFLKIPEGKMEAEPGDNLMISVVMALLLAALLQGFKRKAFSGGAMRVALALLLFSELYTTQFYEMADGSDPNRREYLDKLRTKYAATMNFIHGKLEAEGPFRVDLAAEEGGMNVAAWFRLEDYRGFLASVNRDLYAMADSYGWDRFPDLMNTRYTIAEKPVRDGQVSVFEDFEGMHVFLNPNAGPRAWLTHSPEHITNAAGGGAGVEAPQMCAEHGEEVRITRSTIQRTLIQVRAGCPGYLIVASPYFPGWKADIDGRELPIRRYRGGLRAVLVPGGQSTVQFVYRPMSVMAGAGLSAAGFLLCGVAGLWLWRKREPAPAGSPS